VTHRCGEGRPSTPALGARALRRPGQARERAPRVPALPRARAPLPLSSASAASRLAPAACSSAAAPSRSARMPRILASSRCSPASPRRCSSLLCRRRGTMSTSRTKHDDGDDDDRYDGAGTHLVLLPPGLRPEHDAFPPAPLGANARTGGASAVVNAMLIRTIAERERPAGGATDFAVEPPSRSRACTSARLG
jgi:hypothetical protein